jgi:hypothetical protein
MFKLILLAIVALVVAMVLMFVLCSSVFVAIGNAVVKLITKTTTNIYGEDDKDERK